MTYEYAKHAEKPGHCVYSENELGGTVILAENMTLREAKKHAKELNDTPMTPKRRASERLIALKQSRERAEKMQSSRVRKHIP